MHFVVSEAGTSEIDKAGRILIPGRLRKLVPLDEDQEIILVGLFHRMEIWNPHEWRRYIARSEERYEQNMAKILNLLSPHACPRFNVRRDSPSRRFRSVWSRIARSVKRLRPRYRLSLRPSNDA